MTPARTPYDALPPVLLAELAGHGIEPRTLYDHVVRALAEDVPGEDVTTSATVAATSSATGDFVARADGVLAGLAVAELVLRYVVGASLRLERRARDADRVTRGDTVLSAHGPTALLLTAERSTLNYLCHLSGVATTTAAWVAAVRGTGAQIRDTRKTLPGYRALAKYAVRCGGGVNHRASLSDQALVKDNHVVAAGGAVAAYRAVRARSPEVPVQVEVTTLEQLSDLLDAGAEQILLDNMSIETMGEAVALTRGRAVLEASGGLTIERAREVARTGVDYLAVGALTHSAAALDIAMDLRDA